MTIKELERRTGLPRASIRYYESEGLLDPARLPNGYRDYSEADAVTLEKIKLLRQLHLELETIRLVQRGELTMEQALFAQLNRLEGEKAALDGAAQVCRELERSGADYESLDPAPYLSRLSQPQRPAMMPAPKPWQRLEQPDWAHDHPWMRLLARGIDLGLCSIAVSAALLLGARWNYVVRGRAALWLASTLSMAFMAVCEPLLLHFWGYTPGKWIFGLRLRVSGLDRKLTVGEGLWRTARVIFTGYGADIPGVNLWCAWRFWKRYKAGEDCPWDEEFSYVRVERRCSWLMWLGATAATAALGVLIALQSTLPPNRGALTAAEYCENFNYYLDYFDFDGPRLTPDGEWREQTEGRLVYALPVNGQWDGPEFVLEDGRVTQVRLEEHDTAETIAVTVSGGYGQVAGLALAGADRAFNLFNFRVWEWLALWDGQYTTFETDLRGYCLGQRLDTAGYTGSQQVRVPAEGMEHHYRRTVYVERLPA